MFSDILHIISGPVIGAVIGAFTNYIAIKMLFRPLKEVRIGGIKLPFTPGIIPKHQPQLADALSDTVYKNFFTNNDIEGIFMSEEMAFTFAEGILNSVGNINFDKLLNSIEDGTKSELNESIYNAIHKELISADLGTVIANQSEQIIKDKTEKTIVLGKLVNSEISSSVSKMIGREVEKYIIRHDIDFLLPLFEKKTMELRSLNLKEKMNGQGFDREAAKRIIVDGYIDFMKNSKQKIAESFHIKQFIYNKIMELNPADIERLVNEAIKREMNYLVYLGGILGFIIGIINIFI